jgi:hypothetical protein
VSDLSALKLFANEYVELDEITGYSERHGIHAAPFLTVTTNEAAALTAQRLAPRIQDKVVVEIGGGLGLLALHMGVYAKRVFCIEANPVWAAGFARILMERKPPHVSYLFGTAAEFADYIHADVALFLTHSGVAQMRQAAERFAPEVIDLYGELIDENPDGFDPLARFLRNII